MHLLFLGLLNDATYMLKKQITQTKTNNETRITVVKNTALPSKPIKNLTSTKSEPQLYDIMPKQSTNNLDSYLRMKPSSYKAKEKYVPKFGETVYLPQHLRVDDSNPLIIDYPEFKFHPNDYLLNNTTYFIDYNIFLGVSYIFAAGYNYLVEKHFKTKKNIYISDSEKKPQFFEIIHQPSKRFIKMRDSNFTGDDAYFNKIVEYIESLSVCFTSFDLGYLLYYEEVEVFDGTNKTTTKKYRIDNSLIKTDKSEGHCVSVLVYRNGTDVQVTIIDNNEITSTQEKKLFDFFFYKFYK